MLIKTYRTKFKEHAKAIAEKEFPEYLKKL
jgi:hypothetical protein